MAHDDLEHVQIRHVLLDVAPADATAISERAESIFTLAGGGAVAPVADIGLRLSLGAASGDNVLIQTPERSGDAQNFETHLTLLPSGTQLGRRIEAGYIDGDVGAFFRIDDGSTVRLVVKRSSTVELVSVVAKTIDLTRVHTWVVRVLDRRTVEFFLDGESLGSVAATTGVLFELLAMRSAVRITNPSAATSTATLDVHLWALEQKEVVPPRRVRNAAKANLLVVKAEGGYLRDVGGIGDSASERFLMVFDKAVNPSDGDTPVFRKVIPAGNKGLDVIFDQPFAQRFAVGISVALSTTMDTLTLPGAAEGWFDAGYT